MGGGGLEASGVGGFWGASAIEKERIGGVTLSSLVGSLGLRTSLRPSLSFESSKSWTWSNKFELNTRGVNYGPSRATGHPYFFLCEIFSAVLIRIFVLVFGKSALDQSGPGCHVEV